MELDSMVDYEEQENNLKRDNITIDTVKQKPRLELTQQRQQKLSQSWLKHFLGISNNRKLYSSMLLFLFIICTGIISLFLYDAMNKKNEISVENQVEATSDDLNMNNNKDQSPFRIKSSSDSFQFGRPESLGHMNIYIRKPTHDRSRSSSRGFKFPVARYNRNRFPSTKRFFSFMPKTSIFVDRSTQQTIIYSPTGGVYIIPPLINIYGQLFSVAKLISLGYASLVSTGAPPIGPINMVPYFRSSPLIGPGIPKFSYLTGGFAGGIRVRYGSFSIPKYSLPNMNIGSTASESEDEYDYEPQKYTRKNYKRPTLPPKYTGTYISPKPRALIDVHAHSIVGVLFDPIPLNARAQAKILLDKKYDDFWRQLATQQMQYTQVRLIFRPSYYPDIKPPTKRGTLSLTLPKFFKFKFTTKPYFTTIDGHSLYVRNYTFHNVLITDVDSIAESDDRLGKIGGIMSETFSLPVDPFLILQRTGYACIGEALWPPNSVDPETVEYFYDDTCDVEEAQDPGLIGCQQCHCSYPLANLSCVDALKENIGYITFDLVFKRIRDDPKLAREWRFPADGPSVNALGQVAPVNLFEDEEALARLRFIYLYIEPNGCEIEEKCVGGSGWRRLMLFSTTAPNYGINDITLGKVSYFLTDLPTDYVTKHRIFEFSPCHKHFHFTHYAQFIFGKTNVITNTKHGFCLQTTYRHANTEWSVMSQEHYVCSNQGISPGWSDTYQAGIRCQWIDVTSIDTSISPYTDEFRSNLNPDGFICEGTPINDTWIATDFRTTCCSGSGCCGDSQKTLCCGDLPVEKQACKVWSDAAKDNNATIMVTVPLNGEGQITANCVPSAGSWNEQRDCGFRLHSQGKMLDCKRPGETVILNDVTASTFFQVVRICEASIVLNSCLACIWNSSLITKTIEQGKPQNIEFTCTPARNTDEIGGKFCIYVAPLFEEMEHNPNFVQWSTLVVLA